MLAIGQGTSARSHISTGSGGGPANRTAFSLVELVIVVVILGVLTAVAAPRFFNSSRDAKINATVEMAQRINRCAMIYHGQTGTWPRDRFDRVIPPELKPFLDAGWFSQQTPIGGAWDWNGDGSIIPHKGISVIYLSGMDIPADLWDQLDTRFDDGNLNSGEIRRHKFDGKTAFCFRASSEINK